MKAHGPRLELLVVLLLIVLNGVFAMSELALVSVQPGTAAVLERKGVPGAATARLLSEDPQRFLPTVQVGITLVGILAGVFGGARIAARLQTWLAEVPVLRAVRRQPVAGPRRGAHTYLTLVLGELVPKQLALRRPEAVAAAIAGALPERPVPHRRADRVGARPILRPGAAPVRRPRATQRQARDGGGAEAQCWPRATETGVLETEERDMIERVLRLADKPVRAIMTPRNELAWIDRTDPEADIAATLKATPHSRFVVCDGAVDNVVGVVQAKDILDRILGGRRPVGRRRRCASPWSSPTR